MCHREENIRRTPCGLIITLLSDIAAEAGQGPSAPRTSTTVFLTDGDVPFGCAFGAVIAAATAAVLAGRLAGGAGGKLLTDEKGSDGREDGLGAEMLRCAEGDAKDESKGNDQTICVRRHDWILMRSKSKSHPAELLGSLDDAK